MTQDGQGQRPQDPPAPPARTNWSVVGNDDDGGLLPPFVPGRHGPGQGKVAGIEDVVLETGDSVAGTGDAVAGTGDAAADTVAAREESTDVGEPVADADEPFPFDEAIGEETHSPYDWKPDQAADPGSGLEEPWVPAPMPASELDLDDLEADDAAGDVGALDGLDAGFAPAGDAAQPAAAADVVMDVADRLEELARRIRADGRRGVEQEMASLDRFTSLVAGVVIGYLAGLRD
jgi:hypothetical protein